VVFDVEPLKNKRILTHQGLEIIERWIGKYQAPELKKEIILTTQIHVMQEGTFEETGSG